MQIARLFFALSGLGPRPARHQVWVEENPPSVASAALLTGPLALCVKLMPMRAPRSAQVQSPLISNYSYAAGFVSRLCMYWCQSEAAAADPRR